MTKLARLVALAAEVARLDALTAATDDQVLAAGETTIPRYAAGNSGLAQSSGVLRLTLFTPRRTEQITRVSMVSGGTAAAATPSLCRIGVYRQEADGSFALLSATPNDTTLFATASTVYTRTLTTPFTKEAGRRLAVGALVVTGVGVPTVYCTAALTSAEVSAPSALAGALGGLADLPATIASLAATNALPYAALLP